MLLSYAPTSHIVVTNTQSQKMLPATVKTHYYVSLYISTQCTRCQGVSPSINLQNWKSQFIEDLISNRPQQIPLFILIDTHPDSLEAEMKVRYFTTIHAYREDRRKSGTAIFLHNFCSVDGILLSQMASVNRSPCTTKHVTW